MPPRTTMSERTYREVIDDLDLGEREKRYLRSRWLDQLVWMERAADRARDRYYRLRVTTIVGAVIVPALVSLTVAGDAETAIRWLTFAVSLIVALAAAVEEFFHFGDRWRHYRRTAERLKAEGWRFFQLGDEEGGTRTHATDYPRMAAAVERILEGDVDDYVRTVVAEGPRRDGPAPTSGARPRA